MFLEIISMYRLDAFFFPPSTTQSLSQMLCNLKRLEKGGVSLWTKEGLREGRKLTPRNTVRK